ncbi:MAG: hypothetical protein LBT06_10420 [Hungatella sp.]|nr:hypothetical protein [Hungatella sp.]
MTDKRETIGRSQWFFDGENIHHHRHPSGIPVLLSAKRKGVRMTNLFEGIPEETIETTLNMIQRNLDRIGLYGGHTIRKHTDIQVLALKTRLESEDIIYATSFWDMEVAIAAVKSLMKRHYNPIIRDWLLDTSRDILSLHGGFSKPVGYGFKKGIDILNENLKKACLVLLKDKEADWGFRILTCYPLF